MSQTLFNNRRLIACISLLAILLRAFVPTGFMPSSLASGWYLMLCPDGISGSVLMALLEDQQDHSHHHMHGQGDGTPGSDSAEISGFSQCDLGSGYSSALVFQAAILVLGLFILLYVSWQVFSSNLQGRPNQYLARGPPNKLQYQ